MSFPQAFVDSLGAVPGLSEPQELLKSLDDDSPISIRVNPSKHRHKLSHLSPVTWSNHGYYLPERPSFIADPLFHAGVYYVQEPSSMVIGKVIGSLLTEYYVAESVRVLDLCAAPGGKSTDIISNLRERDLLVSNEVVKSRSHILKENVTKWGYANHLVSNNDPKDFKRLPGYFDIVVIDAPCSGEGMFRKDRRARAEWSPDHVKLCSSRQKRIVYDAWKSIKEGGFLIYATCTFNTSENEQILSFLLKEFEAVKVELSASTEESQNGIYRFFPHVRQGEGFSYFIIQKQSASGSVNLPRMKTRKVDDLPVEIGVEGRVVKENDRFIFYTHDQDSDLLSKQLRMIKKGLSLGVMKKNRWIPDPETSFSVAIKNFLPELDLDPAQALRFLRCETFDLLCEERGYHLIKFEGHGLGYINHLGNRFNNYYPSNWRIRTQQSLNRTALF